MKIHSLEKISAKTLYCLILMPFSLPFTLMWKKYCILKTQLDLLDNSPFYAEMKKTSISHWFNIFKPINGTQK